MTKLDIFSGFLGAGKTTLIKKLLKEAINNEQVVLIENEFGQIGIDGGFLEEAGIEIKEMNSGCICCSLVGDFGTSLKEVLDTYHPDRILIEPSGVGKLSDVMKAVKEAIDEHEVVLNSAVAVVDASKAKMYIKNFGEFFVNQIEHAGTIILSRTQGITKDKLDQAITMIREHNEKATIVTTPWDDLDGMDILESIEGAKDLEAELMAELKADEHDHHHHHDHGPDCTCGCHDHEHHHHHDHDEDEEHEHHHHHDHDEDEEHEHHHHHDHEEEHEHHHDHGPDCTCGCHDHDHEDDDEHDHHHHHHHADEVFASWGYETADSYTRAEIETILNKLEETKEYGIILRAKGMVPNTEGGWIHFDYVPGEINVRSGKSSVTGKFCVIGSGINEEALAGLFLK